MSSEDIGLNAVDEPYPEFSATRDITDITQHISLCERLISDIKVIEDKNKVSLLLEAHGDFANMVERLRTLIDVLQEDVETLYPLLQLNDRAEEVDRFCKGLSTKTCEKTEDEGADNNGTDSNGIDNNGENNETSKRDKGKGKVTEQEVEDITKCNSEIEIILTPNTPNVFGSFGSSVEHDSCITFIKEKTIPNDKPKVGYKPATEPGLCPICYEEVEAEQLNIFEQCNHQYCKECLCGYFSTHIGSGKVLNLHCPSPSCSTIVEYNQIKDVVPPKLFDKYEEFVLLATLNADPSVKWCPKAGCGNAIIGDPENPKCICSNPDCKYEFCFNCSEPWHELTCEQYQQWKVDNGLVDKKFTKWAKNNTKKCPNCKSHIEKMAGCNHMTCYNCAYEFCWLCNGKYSSNHFDVFNVFGCPGMQSGAKQFGAAKRMGMRTLIGSGLVIGGALAAAIAIPAIVVGGPIYLGFAIKKRMKNKSRRPRYVGRR